MQPSALALTSPHSSTQGQKLGRSIKSFCLEHEPALHLSSTAYNYHALFYINWVRPVVIPAWPLTLPTMTTPSVRQAVTCCCWFCQLNVIKLFEVLNDVFSSDANKQKQREKMNETIKKNQTSKQATTTKKCDHWQVSPWAPTTTLQKLHHHHTVGIEIERQQQHNGGASSSSNNWVCFLSPPRSASHLTGRSVSVVDDDDDDDDCIIVVIGSFANDENISKTKRWIRGIFQRQLTYTK